MRLLHFAAALLGAVDAKSPMAWPGRNVGYVTYSPDMIELPRRYDVTITVDRDGGDHPNPAEFAVVAEQAASPSLSFQ